MSEKKLREPTSKECDTNALIAETDEQVAYAIWYPQMGGYSGKAVVAFPKDREPGECFDIAVWHDGEWPFHEGEPHRPLHHCSAEQFIEFGKTVLRLQGEDAAEPTPPEAAAPPSPAREPGSSEE